MKFTSICRKFMGTSAYQDLLFTSGLVVSAKVERQSKITPSLSNGDHFNRKKNLPP